MIQLKQSQKANKSSPNQAASQVARDQREPTSKSTNSRPQHKNTVGNSCKWPTINANTMDEDQSRIADFYDNRSVLITGASGFIGKILIEKLIRTCANLRNVFVLIRPKWNKKPEERLNELLVAPLFDELREKNLLSRVILIEGDVTQPNFGMSPANLLRVMNEVSVVFHSAATVKFDEPMKQSIGINIAGAKNMIDLCRKLPQLAAIVHVSTAYANCNLKSIDEHIYPVEFDPERLIEMANWLEQDALQELKKRLLGLRPNTYTYTKALGEWLVFKCARDLPIVICRPSIVVASWKEPFSGWIDNINGPTGILLGAGKGLIRSMLCEPNNVADLVPSDTVINLIVSLGWFANVYHNHKLNESFDRSVESPFSNNSIASSVPDEYLIERVKHLDDNQRRPSEQLSNQTNSCKFRKLTLPDPPENTLNGFYAPQNEDNFEQTTTKTINQNYHEKNINSIANNNNNNNTNNNISIPQGNFFQSPSQSRSDTSLVTQQNHFNSNSDYESNKSDTNSPHSTSRSSPTEPQLLNTRSILQRNNTGDGKVERVEQQLSYSIQLQIESDQNRSEFEYKLKQFRHDNRAKLISKGLPEEIADVPVFHCTSGKEKPITWGQLQVIIMTWWAIYPSITTYRVPHGSFTNNRRLDQFYRLMLHSLPAHIVDFMTKLVGGKPILVKIFKKFDQAASVLEAFTMNQWQFADGNRLAIVHDFMTEKDKQLFKCDLAELDWHEFGKNYVLGARKFILKEPIDNISEARKNLKFTYIRNLSLQVILIAIVAYFLFSLFQ